MILLKSSTDTIKVQSGNLFQFYDLIDILNFHFLSPA